MRKRPINVKGVLAAFTAAALMACAATAPDARPAAAEPELAGVIAFAPYADVSAKATAFGVLIGNPIVPTLMLANVQQSVVATHGRFRSDLPVYLACYLNAAGRSDIAVVYPSVDRIARMALAHPGSERISKDTLHLLPSERNPHDRYAVFAEDGLFTSFASSAGLARRALADCHPNAKENLPLVRLALRQPALKKTVNGPHSLGLTPTNVIALVDGFVRLDLSLDLTASGLVLAFSGMRDAAPGPGFRERLESGLRDSFKGLSGGDAAMMPTVKVDAKADGVVTGEVCITEEQLKVLGKDFNTLVATQMSGAISDEGAKKGQKKTKGAKGKEIGK